MNASDLSIQNPDAPQLLRLLIQDRHEGFYQHLLWEMTDAAKTCGAHGDIPLRMLLEEAYWEDRQANMHGDGAQQNSLPSQARFFNSLVQGATMHPQGLVFVQDMINNPVVSRAKGEWWPNALNDMATQALKRGHKKIFLFLFDVCLESDSEASIKRHTSVSFDEYMKETHPLVDPSICNKGRRLIQGMMENCAADQPNHLLTLLDTWGNDHPVLLACLDMYVYSQQTSTILVPSVRALRERMVLRRSLTEHAANKKIYAPHDGAHEDIKADTQQDHISQDTHAGFLRPSSLNHVSRQTSNDPTGDIQGSYVSKGRKI